MHIRECKGLAAHRTAEEKGPQLGRHIVIDFVVVVVVVVSLADEHNGTGNIVAEPCVCFAAAQQQWIVSRK